MMTHPKHALIDDGGLLLRYFLYVGQVKVLLFFFLRE